MFENFRSKYISDAATAHVATPAAITSVHAEGFDYFMKLNSGTSFNKGVYRVHSMSEIEKWNRIVGEAFPAFKSRIVCFGYDWLGRQFALDKGRTKDGEPLVLMLEPGTGEALEIPVTFSSFHNDELVEFENEALAADFFNAWHNSVSVPLELNECAGYKVPLFLGGKDNLSNLEVIDMEVYWVINGQLINKIRGVK